MRAATALLSLLALLLIAPSGAFGFAEPGSSGPLRDLDTREAEKPTGGEAKAREKLEESLGGLGFVDTGGTLGGVQFVGTTGGYLTGRTDSSAASVARDFVAEHAAAFGLDADDIAGLEVTDSYTSSYDGVTHVTFSQMVDGVPSWDTSLYANVDKDGRLINASGSPEGDLTLDDPTPELSRREALLAAREDVGGTSAGGPSPGESTRLVAFGKPNGPAELAYAVYAESDDALLYEVVVGADSGEVLARQSRTDFLDQASVWNDHPDFTEAPITVNLAADPTWLDDSAGRTRLKGNNAHAYADIGAPNGVNAGEDIASVGNDWNFPFSFFNQAECPAFRCTWDNTIGGSSATNRAGEVTSLFYLTNRFHDHLLAAPIGFDEASRNFERVNSSGMGVGNDHVLAEGEDSAGTNNANFNTPPDGTSGRMQMFLWNATWDVGGDAAAEVVYHEYGHGLTNRLVGNGAGLGAAQSGAMGEGWSDWYANDFLVSTGDKTDGASKDLFLGDYVIGNNFPVVPGIRRQAMDCNPGDVDPFCPGYGTTGAGGFTFGDLGKFSGANSVHDNGEIWSQTLWDLRERIGSANARAVVTGGLRLSPVAPSFLQMRDAILQSAKNLGIGRRPIWEVFAARGMGFSATTPGSTVFSGVDAFDVPPRLRRESRTITDPAPLGDGDGFAEPGETVRISDKLENPIGDPATGVTGELSTSAPGILIGTDTVSWPSFTASSVPTSSTSPYSVTIPSSSPCGGSVPLHSEVSFNEGTFTALDDDLPLGAPTFTSDSPAAAIPDNNLGGVSVMINLPPGTVSNMDVRIDSLTHTFVGDLEISLTSPSATTVMLMNNRGATGDNMTNTVFDDDATTAITSVNSGNAPFTGSFSPEQPLSTFNGEPQAGNWTLKIVDNAAVDTGTLNTWSLSPSLACSTTAPALPTATTDSASEVAATAATLGGTIDPNGAATDYAFDYGKTTDYGTRTTTASAGAGGSPVAQSAAVSGLEPNTTYHYRALALRAGTVIAVGGDKTFQTLASDPDECPPALAALADAQDAEKSAKKKAKKAKKKLKKAKKSGNKKKIKKAKKKNKKAKKKLKKARAAVAQAQARVDEVC